MDRVRRASQFPSVVIAAPSPQYISNYFQSTLNNASMIPINAAVEFSVDKTTQKLADKTAFTLRFPSSQLPQSSDEFLSDIWQQDGTAMNFYSSGFMALQLAVSAVGLIVVCVVCSLFYGNELALLLGDLGAAAGADDRSARFRGYKWWSELLCPVFTVHH